MHIATPTSVKEACELLAKGVMTPVSGGTDVLVHWPVRMETRDLDYIDLTGIKDFPRLKWTEDELILGGLTTYWDVICDARANTEFPMLVNAARQVGAIQIQSRGTWAGNIANASPAADGVPALMAFDAVVDLTSSRGSESVALSEFYLGYKKMKRSADQLITAIRIPRRKYDLQVFEKVGSRRAQTITKVGVALTHSVSNGWRVVANSVGPTVQRCSALEKLLGSGTKLASADDLLAAVRADVKPIDDIRSTAEYRERVLANLVFHAARA